MFNIGTLSEACSDVPTKDYDTIESEAVYPMLAAVGYLAVQPIKKHVWRVDLTDLGKKSIAGEPYAHKQQGNDCDEWQVTMPLSKFDHLDVTGILEDGAHAKVEFTLTFTITQAGMDVRAVAEKYVFDTSKRKFGEELSKRWLARDLESLLGDVQNAPPSEHTYITASLVA